jgi:hypothetical protein
MPLLYQQRSATEPLAGRPPPSGKAGSARARLCAVTVPISLFTGLTSERPRPVRKLERQTPCANTRDR